MKTILTLLTEVLNVKQIEIALRNVSLNVT